jgi:lipopolysaccharide biosynthesis glycosyltransferase
MILIFLGPRSGAILNSSSAEEGARQFHRLGIEGNRYFNSGVLVCDLTAWRTRRVGERALAFARSAGNRLVLWDQDALNATLVGDWLELPEKWNRWASSVGPLEDCIIHFTMSPKPWHADYRGRGGDLFWSLVDETAFRGTRPWNPFGLGSTIRRLRARVPYAPTVGRVLREKISGALRR